VLTPEHVEDEALYTEEDSSSGNSTPPSPVFDAGKTTGVYLRDVGNEEPTPRGSSSSSASRAPSEGEPERFATVAALTAHEISTDLSKYPPLDHTSQDEIVSKYRQHDEIIRSEGLYQCSYVSYAFEFARSSTLFVLLTFLRYSYYALSSLCLGLCWQQLAFIVHDAGHMGITHGFHTDSLIGLFIADFMGGLSIGWWKRNHNVHHIVTNSPENDPDIKYLPFLALSHRFFPSLRSTYYETEMVFDATAWFLT
jgi:sphingolipid 8-(E)-desaturase